MKLIDLGCSIYKSETHMSHYVQSRSYRAPEVGVAKGRTQKVQGARE